MRFRLSTALIAIVLTALVSAASGGAAEFVDSAGRRVVLPARIERVMPAGPVAAVLVLALAPDKLIGWAEPLARVQRAYLPAKIARLPVIGRLAGPYPTATAADVVRLHPDLIIEAGPVTAAAAQRAEEIERQTGIPYIVLDGSIQRTPEMLRDLGNVLGVGDRRFAVSSYAYHAIDGLRGRLLLRSADDRPTVYYGRGADGLETGLAGSVVMSDIDQAGAINVAGRLGRGELVRVSRDQIRAWDPDIIIAQRRSFYDALRRDRAWRGLAAVRHKRVYVAPADPFGWIADPPGVNRMVGLYWLSALFYPDPYQQDLRTTVRDFYQLYYGLSLSPRQLEALVGPAAPQGQPSGAATVSLFGAEPPPLPSPAPNTGPGVGPAELPLRPPGRAARPGIPAPSAPANPY